MLIRIFDGRTAFSFGVLALSLSGLVVSPGETCVAADTDSTALPATTSSPLAVAALAEPASVQQDQDKSGQLGSTMTLDQIGRPKKKRIERQQSKEIAVRPAAESVPALQYRLWQPEFMRIPGSAQMHFFRAMVLWDQMSPEFRNQVETWTGEDVKKKSDEVSKAMETLTHVFDELHLLAESEDTKWDHRLRDIRGPAVYSYLLPEVQQSRSLARVLQRKIQLQIHRGDYAGAIDSLRDGFRLAHFVGQGETLVQQLVGIAIFSIMLDQVEQLIQLDDAPNMYWPLATLPRPFTDINQSIEFELNAVHRILPVLDEAEKNARDEDYWNRRWGEVVQDFSELAGTDQPSKVAFALLGVASAGPAKKRLIAAGMDQDEVESMAPIRAVFIDASREIRKVASDLGKANFLPSDKGQAIAERESERFEEWFRENQFQSGGAAIVGLLFPAVQAAKTASLRQEYFVNRLMTIEAIRMHAAENNGKAPRSLDELSVVPAMDNPFAGEAFQYSADTSGRGTLVTISAEVPPSLDFAKTIRVRIAP